MGVTDTKTGLPEKGAVATESKKGRMGLFSKERALYLVDNPTKMGASWTFFLTGIAAGYWMAQRYGVSESIYKVATLLFFLSFVWIRRWVEKRVKANVIGRDSALLYLVLPAGYVFTFLCTMWLAHIFFE